MNTRLNISFVFLISIAALAPLFALTSCTYSKPAAFEFIMADGLLSEVNALSEAAQSGSIPLGEDARFEYKMNEPLLLSAGAAFTVEYAIETPQDEISVLQSSVTASLKDGPSFVLPLDFSFAGVLEAPRNIFYSMPLNTRRIESFTFENKAQKNAPSPSRARLKIKRILIERQRVGFEKKDSSLFITPFVYKTPDSKTEGRDFYAEFNIEPDKRYFEPSSVSLLLSGIAKNARLVFDERDFIYMGAEGGSITFPPEVFSGGYFGVPYPLKLRVPQTPPRDMAFLVQAAPPSENLDAPIAADPGIILSLSQNTWRNKDYEVYKWDIFPSILIFDTASYEAQSRFFKRLAFFSEKKGFRQKIARDEDMAGQHGWNAHDYSAATVADFFNTAQEINFPLSGEEEKLKSILLENGVITFDKKSVKYGAGAGAVISISRESPFSLRLLFMNHEAYHGLFFIDKDFRNFSAKCFASLSPASRRFLLSFFDFSQYDIKDDFLVLNEFNSYCLQQGAGGVSEYFKRKIPLMIEKSEWRRPMLPEKDAEWKPIGEDFTRQALALSRYVSERWGLEAGRVWRVKPVSP